MPERDPVPTGKAKLFKMDSRLHRPWKLLDGENYHFLTNVITPESIVYGLIRAMSARRHAESYRGFSVGVWGIIYRSDGQSYSLTHGANFKNGPGNSDVDIHAEEFVVNSLQAGDKLAGLTVIAPLQADSASGKETPTLHPCYKCREKIAGGGGSTKDTLIVCATPDITAVQWGGIEDYIRYHAGEDNGMATARFSEMPALFRPLGIAPGEPIDLSDPSLDIDTTEWDNKITYPVWEWIKSHQGVIT